MAKNQIKRRDKDAPEKLAPSQRSAKEQLEVSFMQEVEEDIRQKRLEALWNKYGAALITIAVALVVFVMGYEGWSAWRNYQNIQQTEGLIASSDLLNLRSYEDAQAVADGTVSWNDPAVQQGLQGFIESDASGAHKMLGQFALAKAQVAGGDLAAAAQTYEALRSDATRSTYQDMATILWARTVMAQDGWAENDETVATLRAGLTSLASPSEDFYGQALELLALIYAEQGAWQDAEALLAPVAGTTRMDPALRERLEKLRHVMQIKQKL